jgi:glycosyltransferase involved in cell wall biosynthesis
MIKSSVKSYSQARPKGFESFTDSRAGSGLAMAKAFSDSDLVNFHWIGGFVDWSVFAHPEVSLKPIVITLHDMNAFTGGCHYTSGCEKFVKCCGSCPQLGSESDEDASRANWNRKRAALRQRKGPTSVVGSSNWISEQAKKSSLVGELPIKTIHYGIDLDLFYPRDKAAARKLMSIPGDAAVVMFAAAGVGNPRKGFAYLAEAMSGMQSPRKVVLLSVGAGNPKVEGNLDHIHLGPLDNDVFLSAAYSAADVFVIPSLEENFALTALEATACGLPIVGFNAGGIPELIEHARTGFVVPLKDSVTLRAAILDVISDRTRCAALGVSSRKRTEELFSMEIASRKYRALYEELCVSAEA